MINLKKEILSVSLNNLKFVYKKYWYKELIERTNYLENPVVSEMFFHVINDLNEVKRCKSCPNPVKFLSFNKGYSLFCSNKCSRNDILVKEKLKNSYKEKYGVESLGSFQKLTEIPKITTEIEKKEIIKIINENNGSVVLKKLEGKKLKGHLLNLTKKLNENSEWSERFNFIKNDLKEIPKCKICLKNNSKWNPYKNYYTVCSKNCKSILVKNNTNYNDIVLKNKILINSRKIIQEKYGVENIWDNIEFKENFLNKNFNDKDFFLGENYELLEFRNNGFNLLKHNECGKIFKINETSLNNRLKNGVELCNICNKYVNNSIAEDELYLFIKNLGIKNIILNDRNLIKPKEIDILIPEFKLAIEFNGLFWHSSNQKGNNYHKDKSNRLEKLNYKLIHIKDYDWINKKEIIKSIIKNYIGINEKIFARKCLIREVGIKEEREFLNNNHLQGYNSSSVCYGLYYEDELVQIMSFKELKTHWEIQRLCSKTNLNITGGTERLWKKFLTEKEPKKIITYSDRDYFTGKIYEKLGMILEKITNPGYFYTNGKIIINRQSCQKHKLIKKFPELKESTEKEIMEKQKFFQYHNSGNYKFYLKR